MKLKDDIVEKRLFRHLIRFRLNMPFNTKEESQRNLYFDLEFVQNAAVP